MKVRIYSGRTESERSSVRIKRMAAVTLGVASVLGMGAVLGGGQASAISFADGMQINPVYQRYMQDVAAGKGSTWKVIPNKYVYVGETGGKGGEGDVPASYNLVDAGYGTALKNQGQEGMCWAYATTTAIESNLKKTQGASVELSPKQLDYLASSGSPYYSYMNTKLGLTRVLGDGGSFALASYPMSGQYAPVLESKFFAKLKANDSTLSEYSSWKEYQDVNTVKYLLGAQPTVYNKALDASVTMGEKSDYTVTKYRYYNGANTDVVANIKNDVYKYGAAYVETVGPETANCWDATTDTVVDKGVLTCGSGNGHAMAVVGWDDTHIYKDPASGETKTGAFLLQNSWGKSNILKDYGWTYEKIVQALIAGGSITSESDLTEEQKAKIHAMIDDLNMHEYVWLGYEFDTSTTNGEVGFASIQKVEANNYAKIYDSMNQAEGLGGSGAETDALEYVFTTGGATEYVNAVALDTHMLAATRDIDYTLYVDASGKGDNYVETGKITMPAGEAGKETVSLSSPITLNGAFNLKLVAEIEGQVVTTELFTEEYEPYLTVAAYTSSDEPTPVPDTSGDVPSETDGGDTSEVTTPNTGMFTGDNNGVFGGVAAIVGILMVAGLNLVVMKNRKSLFHKIGFDKKGF